MLKPLISWQAPEYEHQPKSVLWFVAFFIIMGALIFLGVWWRSLTMIILILLGGGLIVFFSLREPVSRKFSLLPSGIKIDQELYKFSEFKSFWIFYDPPEVKEISFRRNALFSPKLIIPLADQDPSTVRKILLNYLPEKKEKESVTDNIARKLGL